MHGWKHRTNYNNDKKAVNGNYYYEKLLFRSVMTSRSFFIIFLRNKKRKGLRKNLYTKKIINLIYQLSNSITLTIYKYNYRCFFFPSFKGLSCLSKTLFTLISVKLHIQTKCLKLVS